MNQKMNSMIDRNKFKGTGVAITTPFNQDNKIDINSLYKQIEHVITGRVNYIVLFGTTGEAPTISIEEKQHIATQVVNYISGRVPLVIGFGGNNTTELVHEIINFDFKGIDAILSVCPYYNKPNQDGIYAHYAEICKNSPLPIILYNVPGRSIINIEPSTTIRLAKNFDSIIAIKEATDNLDHVMELLHHKPEHLLVIAGDDALALPFISLGADGVISVISNAFPKEFSNLIQSALNGDYEQARLEHYKLLPLMHTLLKSGNPAGIKAVLNVLGLCEYRFRLPVFGANEIQFEKIRHETLVLVESAKQ
jgi:4-hydroxy-tetrahydrodipicolinate synthase